VVYIRGELEQDVGIGDSFRALTDAPGQTATNWDILESNGYVENNATNQHPFCVIYPNIPNGQIGL
jgi:hypothetical protein